MKRLTNKSIAAQKKLFVDLHSDPYLQKKKYLEDSSYSEWGEKYNDLSGLLIIGLNVGLLSRREMKNHKTMQLIVV